MAGGSARVDRAFLRFFNRVEWARLDSHQPHTLLVLLPHCLDPRVREEVGALLGEFECRWRVVGGGAQAVRAVEEVRPECVLAVACEPELVEGLYAIGARVPWVLTFPRDPGLEPCRGSGLDLMRFRRVMHRLAKRHQSA